MKYPSQLALSSLLNTTTKVNRHLFGNPACEPELQLQLLTQRNQPGPRETWAQDVAQVLSGPHEEATARRLQNALKNLLRS
jgi:hypothetical protein